LRIFCARHIVPVVVTPVDRGDNVMAIQTLAEFFTRQLGAAASLTSLGALLDARVSGTPLAPDVEATARHVLALQGLPADAFDNVTSHEALPLLGMLRFILGTQHQLLYAHRRASGWNYADPDILQAGGDGSIGHANGLTRMVVPGLDGLAERFAKPGATFLDVGVGAAGLSIAMARMWPELRLVGLDVWQPSLAIARANVDKAGLANRIELREQAVENLTEVAAYDFVWLPLPFIPADNVPAAVAATCRALKPGGWINANMTNPNGDPDFTAVGRLLTAIWGGGQFTTTDVETMLRDAGLVDVRMLPTPPGAPACAIVGRKV
jgi:SAM-dependent methyltransferase